MTATSGSGPAPPAPSGASAPFVLLGEEGVRAFDAEALEQDLRSLWKSPPGARTSFYRAALANLVLPLDRDGFTRFSDVLAGVVRRHPARLIRIGPASRPPPDPARLSARATALCHLREGGGGFVCSEEIVLEHTEATAPLLPSAVRALLIGDLPVVFLGLTGIRAPWIDALAALADVQVADSCIEERPAALGDAWRRTGRKGAPMHDLAWARLEPWRAALAGLFDHPDAAAALGSIGDVAITHGGEGPSSPAWLLAGWMASRLGWTLAAREGASFRFRAAGGSPRVVFVRAEAVSAREVTDVRVRAGGAHPLDARLSRAERGDTARLDLRSPREVALEIPFARRSLAEAIVGEIQRRGPNPAFRDAARAARTMTEA